MQFHTNVVPLLAAWVALATFSARLMIETAAELRQFWAKGVLAGTITYIFVSPAVLVWNQRSVVTSNSATMAYLIFVLLVLTGIAAVGFDFIVLHQLYYSDEKIGFISVVAAMFFLWLFVTSIVMPNVNQHWHQKPCLSFVILSVASFALIPAFCRQELALFVYNSRVDFFGINLPPELPR